MLKKWFVSLVALFLIAGYSIELAAQSIAHAKAHEVFIPARECKLFCRTLGKGKPLVVIHAGPGLSQDYLLPHLYQLAENHFVIFYDQRGSGRSSGEINEDTINIDTFVKDIESIRKAFAFDKISILGHSWGGFLALHYAIAHRDNVEKLIVSNCEPASVDELELFKSEYARRIAPYQEKISAMQSTKEFLEGKPEAITQFYRLLFRTYCHTQEKADLLQLHMSPTAAINGFKVLELVWQNTFKGPFNLHPSLKNLRIPTLVIHGDSDPVPSITAQHIHESIPGSKYVLLKECGHFPFVEQPTAYFQSLKEFLK
jgi:proline iminopeptidase